MNTKELIKLGLDKIEGRNNLKWSDIGKMFGISGEDARQIVKRYRKQHGLLPKREDIVNENIMHKLQEIELKRLELEKERKKIQTEKNEINKWLREQARIELFYERLENAIKERYNLEIPQYIKPDKKAKRDAIVTIADCHYGKEVNIIGLKGEVLNIYNVEIFERRMWDLLGEIIKIINKEGLNHINVVNLSDSIDGILRMSQLQSLQLGVVESVIGFSDFMVNWLNELSKYVRIDYYNVLGNHNEIRPLGSQRGEFPHENTERIISWYLKTALANNPNVDIHIGESYVQYFSTVGVNILAVHGQDEKDLEKSLKDYMLLYNQKIDILLAGHLHHNYEKTIAIGDNGEVEVIQSPSIIGLDDFSMRLKRSSSAGAKLFILEEGKGRTITYKISLS
jgi:hypothetical protein